MAGLVLMASAVKVEAQRATMQVTVQVVHGNTITNTPAEEQTRVLPWLKGAATGTGQLTVGSVAPWQLLVTTEPSGHGEVVARPDAAGEGMPLAAGAPGATVTVPLPGHNESSIVTYVLVTN